MVVDFPAGKFSGDGGVTLLCEVGGGLEVIRALAGCFLERCDQRLVEYSMQQLLTQRLYGLALGDEDLNDHEQLRREPPLATACDESC